MDETIVFGSPGGFQEALGGHSWRFPGCARTLWDTTGGLWDALGVGTVFSHGARAEVSVSPFSFDFSKISQSFFPD